MREYPNKLRLQSDGRLVMDDGTSVEKYLHKFAKKAKIEKGMPMPVIVQSRDVAAELLYQARLAMMPRQSLSDSTWKQRVLSKLIFIGYRMTNCKDCAKMPPFAASYSTNCEDCLKRWLGRITDKAHKKMLIDAMKIIFNTQTKG
jgi:hypothetical protein